MDKETKEVIKLTIAEVLRLIANRIDIATSDIRISGRLSDVFRQNYPAVERIDWKDVKRKIQRLKQRGLINKTFQNKTYYLEITEPGSKYLDNADFRALTIGRPAVWDKKWRIVIYDIPEKRHALRDVIRKKLYDLGFEQIQKSVFVYPFECTDEVNLICRKYGERSHIKFMIADIIEGEESVIETFVDKGTLKLEDLV